MRVVVENTLSAQAYTAYDGEAGFTIGRDAGCGVPLDSRFVSAVHAIVERSGEGWDIELPPDVDAVQVDDQPLEPGQRRPLREISRVELATFVLVLDATEARAAATGGTEQRIDDLLELIHRRLLHRLDLRGAVIHHEQASPQRVEELNTLIDDLLDGEFHDAVYDADVAVAIVRRAVCDQATVSARPASDGAPALGVGLELEAQKRDMVKFVLDRAADGNGQGDATVSHNPTPAAIEDALRTHWASLMHNVKTYVVAQYIKKQLADVIFGLGPLQDLILDTDVSEVMVVNPSLIYVESKGRLTRSPRKFISDAAAVSVIERIVAPLGRRIDRSSPLVDARLKDGSRVNAVIPPVAIGGSCITIRKFPAKGLTVDDLVGFGSLTPSAVALLRGCVGFRANLVVAGGTGSGKTTLLNALSGMIPEHERVVTIEDAAELRLQQEHVISLETRPPSADGGGELTIRDLVKNALRMRPDRIIVGECRGAEALDMLQAMNTGHRGSMTTVHANSSADVIARIETMVLTGAPLPLPALRRQLAGAVDLIVYIQRAADGKRRVTQITEVVGIDPHEGHVETRDLMALDASSGALAPTGYMPTFLDDMVRAGCLDLERWFEHA